MWNSVMLAPESHNERWIVCALPGPLEEIAVGFRGGGHVIMHLWICGRQDIISADVARVESAHFVKDLLPSLPSGNSLSKLDLVRRFIEPLHAAMLKLPL